MECPNCGHKLPHLAAVLARTSVGTQCPRCWTRLRNLEPPLVAIPKKKGQRPAEPKRRAA